MGFSICMRRFVFAALATVLLTSAANAAVIASHTGANDPTSEGLGPFNTIGGVEGIDQTHGPSAGAWNIDTTPGTTNHYGYYERLHSGADIAALSDPTNSVVFTMTFKILADETRDNNGSFSVSGAFSIGSIVSHVNNEWLFLMGLKANNDLVIRPYNGSPMTFANGLNTFHTIRLEDLDGDDVNLSLAGLQRDFDVYVDNVFQYTSVGAGGTANRVFWGEASGSEADATSVDWSVFRLETAPIATPEPHSLALMIIGVVPMLRRLRKNIVK